MNGYLAALNGAGIEQDQRLIFYGHFTVESGYAMAHLLLTQRPRPTAILAANNFIAIGVLRALHEIGLQVPENMSLVAFDDLPLTYTQAPLLTVAAQPAYELGTIATQRLLKRVTASEEQAVDEIILPPELIIRASTSAPNGA